MAALNQIGFHFVGGFSQAECDTYFGLLNDTRPGCITIKGAEQYPQALDFAKACVKAYPGMRTIFRHMVKGVDANADDTGRMTRVTAEQWWLGIGRLHINTGLTVLSDNETSMARYEGYAAWQAAVMRYAGDQGVAIAYGRHSTHHVDQAQQPQLDAMYQMAGRYGRLHSFSPNVYWSADNLDGFSFPGYAMARAAALGVTLDVTIGELGLLRDIRDAHHGWRSCGVDGKAYGRDVIAKARTYLPGIPVCLFSIGAWP